MVSSTPRPHFTPGKDPVPILQEVGWTPGQLWTGGKFRPLWDSIPDHPARSQSLCRLSREDGKCRNSRGCFLNIGLLRTRDHIFLNGMSVCLCAMNERHAVSKASLSERKSCHKQMHKNWSGEERFVASSELVKIILTVTFRL